MVVLLIAPLLGVSAREDENGPSLAAEISKEAGAVMSKSLLRSAADTL